MHLHYHGSSHNHDAVFSKRLKIAAYVTLAFLLFETAAGFYSHGLSILSDAAQNLIDFLALLLVCWSQSLANKPPDRLRTFGYQRVKVLVALVNAAVMAPVLLQIAFQAIQRAFHPELVDGTVLGIVGIVGLVCNIAVVLLLKSNKDQLHVRGAYLHNIADAFGSVLILVAGIVISKTGAYWLDMVVALVICALIVYTLVPIVKKSVHILLEGAPEGFNTEEVEKAILGVPGIAEIHDLHAWDHGDGQAALTCHVKIEAASDATKEHGATASIRTLLRDRFGITHATIQLEQLSCSQQERCAASSLP